MHDHPVVSTREWIAARKALLDKEKELTRLRDELSSLRRELPWTRATKSSEFRGTEGSRTLADLFGSSRQLIVYHFMYGPDWETGCPSCSFWAENYQGTTIHLANRDAGLVVISRAAFEKLAAYRERMGWTFPWHSSHGSDFNFDFQVSYLPEQIESGEAEHNYVPGKVIDELPGVSVFFRDEDDTVYHTYSMYRRGLDMLNGAYHHMDLLPLGRDEEGLPWPMARLRRRDQYTD
ncbi:MAG: putative dithiol-disulfide oxidoreductase (DUF899 family) [Halieaceae bacterium]|jgi:predicted dithiol-disulfide oxidoreductase (DUF899 family)